MTEPHGSVYRDVSPAKLDYMMAWKRGVLALMRCWYIFTVLEQDKERETQPNGELKVGDQTEMTVFEMNLKDKRFVVAILKLWRLSEASCAFYTYLTLGLYLGVLFLICTSVNFYPGIKMTSVPWWRGVVATAVGTTRGHTCTTCWWPMSCWLEFCSWSTMWSTIRASSAPWEKVWPPINSTSSRDGYLVWEMGRPKERNRTYKSEIGELKDHRTDLARGNQSSAKSSLMVESEDELWCSTDLDKRTEQIKTLWFSSLWGNQKDRSLKPVYRSELTARSQSLGFGYWIEKGAWSVRRDLHKESGGGGLLTMNESLCASSCSLQTADD